jgi:hypothetical protein
MRNAYQVSVRKLKGRYHLEAVGVCGRVIEKHARCIKRMG